MNPQQRESSKEMYKVVKAFKEYLSALDLTKETDIKKLGCPCAITEFSLFKESCEVFGGSSKEWYNSLPKLLRISGQTREKAMSLTAKALDLSLIKMKEEREKKVKFPKALVLLEFLLTYESIDKEDGKQLLKLSKWYASMHYDWYEDAWRYFGAYSDDWYGAVRNMLVLNDVTEMDAFLFVNEINEITSRTTNKRLYSFEEAKEEVEELLKPLLRDSATELDFCLLNRSEARKNPWFGSISSTFRGGWYLFIDSLLKESLIPKERRNEFIKKIKSSKKSKRKKCLPADEIDDGFEAYLLKHEIDVEKGEDLHLLFRSSVERENWYKSACSCFGGKSRSWYHALMVLLTHLGYEYSKRIVKQVK